MTVSLNNLILNQKAEIINISGPNEQVGKLEEFGIRSGIKIRKIRSGIFKIRGMTVCLRMNKEICILCEVKS